MKTVARPESAKGSSVLPGASAPLHSAVAPFWIAPWARSERRPGAVFFRGTGALLNNSRQDGTPYFLTSNHCLLPNPLMSRCRETAPLGEYPDFEAFWDYTQAGCDAGLEPSGPPALHGLPRTRGATLLAADAANDFALLRLESAPSGSAGRTFLGWSAVPLETGVTHRLSHPHGLPQTYARHRLLTAGESGDPFEETGSRCCRCRSRRSFLHSVALAGGIGPGSSGAPLVTDRLHVVGQLWGACQRGRQTVVIDGRFDLTYAHIRRWIDPLGLGTIDALTLH